MRSDLLVLVSAALLLAACGSRTPVTDTDVDMTDSVPEPQPPERPVVLPEPEPEVPEFTHELGRFFEALDRAERGEGVAVILHIGDSHTASDTYTGRLRELFMERFGDAGRGLAQPGVPWRGFRQESMSYDMSDSWEVENGVTSSWEPPMALTGVRIHSATENATVTREICDTCRLGGSFDRFSVHYLLTPGGGSFRVLLDGEELAVVSTDAEADAFGVFSREVELGHEIIEVQLIGDGRVSLFGFATEDNERGVRYEAFGLNGARVTHYRGFDETMVADQVRERSPDLLVMALGTNEAYGPRFRVTEDDEGDPDRATRAMANYAEEVVTMVERMRAGAPDADCLLVLSPDFHDDDQPCASPEAHPLAEGRCVQLPPDSLARVIEAQLAAAHDLGCATWDAQRAMGGPGSFSLWQEDPPEWARGDGVHFSMRGYDRLGEALFDDLMLAYESWLAGDPQPVSASPIPLDVEEP